MNWLKLLHQNNVNGVLADDMGLGESIRKTERGISLFYFNILRFILVVLCTWCGVYMMIITTTYGIYLYSGVYCIIYCLL